MSLSTSPNGSAASEAAAAEAAAQMLMRLGDPQVVGALTTLLDRLDLIVVLVDSLDGLLRHSETVLESAMQSAGEARATVQAAPGLAGIDVPRTLAATSTLAGALPEMAPALTSPALLQTLNLLSEPGVADGLGRLVTHIDMLVVMIEALDGLVQRSETILESAIQSGAELRTTFGSFSGMPGIDLAETVASVSQLASALPDMTPALVRGAKSGAIDELTSPALVNMLRLVSGGARDALADPEPVRVSGALSLARVLKDPDVARSISFFATLGRAVGRALDPNPQ